MKASKIDNSQEELFQSRLSSQLNPEHEMVILSKLIPWNSLDKEFNEVYDKKDYCGQPPKAIRLMVGLLMLQHIHDLSDEQVVSNWVENAYWQYFCGYDFLQWQAPINPSSLTRFRKRMGSKKIEKILDMTIGIALNTKLIKKKDLKKVIVDSTVMPKNIEYPTDSRLYEKARKRLVELSKKFNINLRQNYNLVSKRLIKKLGGYLHAKQMKRAGKLIKHLKVITGRVQRDVIRKIDKKANKQELSLIFSTILEQTSRLLKQEKKSKNKLYSIHEPEVYCINKGKIGKKSEFGSKVSTVLTHKQGFILRNESLSKNMYDGHSLKGSLENTEKSTGVKIEQGFVDKGYKGHGIENKEIYISGQRGLSKSLKKALKRRQMIEPIIGHMKQDGKLDVCRLKGVIGNEINATLVGAGQNIRSILKHIKKIVKSGDLSVLYNAIIFVFQNLRDKIRVFLVKLKIYFFQNYKGFVTNN